MSVLALPSLWYLFASIVLIAGVVFISALKKIFRKSPYAHLQGPESKTWMGVSTLWMSIISLSNVLGDTVM